MEKYNFSIRYDGKEEEIYSVSNKNSEDAWKIAIDYAQKSADENNTEIVSMSLWVHRSVEAQKDMESGR